MSVVAEHPSITIAAAQVQPATGKDAAALALGYLRWASACWRGDVSSSVFETRLSAYWRPVLPLRPAGNADAISPHGGGGRGISWYQTDDEVLGYIPGGHGGYRVPLSAVARLVRCASPTIEPALHGSAFDPERHDFQHVPEIDQRVRVVSS